MSCVSGKGTPLRKRRAPRSPLLFHRTSTDTHQQVAGGLISFRIERMRVAWPSTPSPFSAARYFAASFLLLSSQSHAAPRRTLTFAHQQARRVAGSSSTGVHRSSNSNKRRLRSCTSTTAVRAGCVTSTAMGSNGADGGGSGVIETAPSLPMFLQGCSSAARMQQQQQQQRQEQQGAACFHVFSGNEACDADSMCSAICMALLKQSTAAAAAGGDDGGVVYIPGESQHADAGAAVTLCHTFPRPDVLRTSIVGLGIIVWECGGAWIFTLLL